MNLSTCDILRRIEVLDAIFLSKTCDIRIEAKILRHVVTPILEDVANIFHLLICGSQDPFNIALTSEDRQKLEILQKGTLTFPSTSFRFSNWIQYFGNVNREEPCQPTALISLWLLSPHVPRAPIPATRPSSTS
ncbi:hypothetical protein L3X38_016500 [Prunus dulcis]|uniref:Uncharacterized protein n=1 Tax=Prunus dulcis TaxID=3755 RepID=A0AAD4W7Y8_PRUDU|nr:hypothetical protein L3X38_016500 [Prunus dulcis]